MVYTTVYYCCIIMLVLGDRFRRRWQPCNLSATESYLRGIEMASWKWKALQVLVRIWIALLLCQQT